MRNRLSIVLVAIAIAGVVSFLLGGGASRIAAQQSELVAARVTQAPTIDATAESLWNQARPVPFGSPAARMKDPTT